MWTLTSWRAISGVFVICVGADLAEIKESEETIDERVVA